MSLPTVTLSGSQVSDVYILLEVEGGKDVCAYQLLTRVVLLFIIMSNFNIYNLN